MKRWIVLFSLLALPAVADFGPESVTRVTDCVYYRMCDAEGDTGICERTVGGASGDIVATIAGTKSLTLFGTSSNGTYTCDLYGATRDCAAAATCNSQDLTTTSLSDTGDIISLTGNLDRVWVSCSAIQSEKEVTVDKLACY